MAVIRLNKTEAARRQIDAGVRMLFSGEDPVAIHTLAMAGFRVLRDLAKDKGDSYMQLSVEAIIAPGKENQFWGTMNRFSNFLKHADHDPDAILEDVEEEVNDFMLFLGSLYYNDLQKCFSPEMSALCAWCIHLYPFVIKDECLPAFPLDESLRTRLCGKSRAEQIEIAHQMLGTARRLDLGQWKKD